MAREKIEIKRIDKRSARQVTYSKRRKGLIKKAHELSILCDSEVALMVFSCTGKFTHFASTSLDDIIDKYIQSKALGDETNRPSTDYNQEKATFERLTKQVEETEIELRQMQGQDLESLSIKELEKLEKNIATSLNIIHKRKEMNFIEENEQLRQQVNALMATKENVNSEEEFRLSFESVNITASNLTDNIDYEDVDTTLRLGI